MVVDLFLVYQFIRRLATPFNKWKAYELGIIDDEGKVLIKRKDFTQKAQRKAWGVYDIMIANIKKLLGKVRGGKSRLASYAAALFLIKEYKHFSDDSLLTEDLTDEQLEESLALFEERYIHYNTLVENVNENIHKDVIKAYKKSLDAEHRDAEYGTTATKRAVTRTANTLSRKINQHHPDLDMQGKIKLRTQLQNMKESDLDELSMSLKDLTKSGINKKGYGDKEKLKKDLEALKKGLKKESLEESTVRWKRAGANGEIQATIGGKKYQIEKALDHNERHKGEWKVMVWDKRRDSWEWETTEYGKANAKAWIMNRIKEEAPANSVAAGGIAGMDGSAFSKAAQKKWTSRNKSKKKKIRDMLGDLQ